MKMLVFQLGLVSASCWCVWTWVSQGKRGVRPGCSQCCWHNSPLRWSLLVSIIHRFTTDQQRCTRRGTRCRTTAAPGRSGRSCSGPLWPWWSRSSSRCGAARNAPSGKRTWRTSFVRANTAGTTQTCSISPPTAACVPSTSCKELSATAAACAPTSSACAGLTAACRASRSWPPPGLTEPWNTAGSGEMSPSPAIVQCANSSVGRSRSSAISGSWQWVGQVYPRLCVKDNKSFWSGK